MFRLKLIFFCLYCFLHYFCRKLKGNDEIDQNYTFFAIIVGIWLHHIEPKQVVRLENFEGAEVPCSCY